MSRGAGIAVVISNTLLLPSKKNQTVSMRETAVPDRKGRVMGGLSFTERESRSPRSLME